MREGGRVSDKCLGLGLGRGGENGLELVVVMTTMMMVEQPCEFLRTTECAKTVTLAW